MGIWRNFDELEEALTLEELFTLYDEVINKEIRQFKNFARAQGADIDFAEDYGEPEKARLSKDDWLDNYVDNSNDPLTSIINRIDGDDGETNKGVEFGKMKMGYKRE